jgi:beta-glucosidase
MSSTWDVDLIKHWGTLMGEEFFLKGVNVALSPGANFARYPGNGRLFEYIASEDPFLGQSLVQPLVSGIQSQNVIATVKHFINNNQDYHRYDIDEVLDERTMMELYMPTFLGAVEAGVGAAMCGYNKVNGLHACEQPQTLLTFKKLGFSGWMMSDWGGTHSTSINQGLDMEMPDGVYMGAPLAAAVAAGNVTVAKVNDSVLRILTPMFAMGQFDKLNPNKGDANVTSVEHSRAARELASKSIILLQNEPALGSVPLPALPIAAYMAAAAQQSSVFRIGVLGRHAHTLPISGGGGSGVTGGPYTISLFSALALRLSINLLPPDCEAQQSTWQQGIEFFDTQPPFDLVKVKDMMACGELCVNTTNCNFFNYYASTSMCKMLMTNEFRMVNADASSGTCRMDGQWQCNEPQGGQQACIALVDGYIGDGFVGDWYEATKLVRESDMTIVSVGMFTKESKDRLTLALEQSQDALIDMARVTSQSKPNVTPIVVVMSSPGAQLTPWRFDISAICVNFGTGQAHGLALVDVLFGDVNPSARLPVTFPNMDNEQRWTPSQYPGVANVSTYSEKLRVGYRWYNQYMVMPAFPFGHGLSYTSFGYSDFILKSMQDGSVMATVTITNTGNY